MCVSEPVRVCVCVCGCVCVCVCVCLFVSLHEKETQEGTLSFLFHLERYSIIEKEKIEV